MLGLHCYFSTFALSIRETTSCDERNDVSAAEKRRNAQIKGTKCEGAEGRG